MDQPNTTPQQETTGQIDVAKVGDTVRWKYFVLFMTIVAYGIVVVALILLVVTTFYGKNAKPVDIESITFQTIFGVAFFIVLVYRLRPPRPAHVLEQQMVSSFGYAYSLSAPLDSVAAQSLRIGVDSTIHDVMSGVYHAYPVRIFSCYPLNVLRQPITTVTNVVFELTFVETLPHILLMPVSDFANLSVSFEMNEVKLEGDFQNHFVLLVGRDGQVQTREIFEPDVMQELLQKFSKYSLEIIGTKVYLYRKGPIYQREDYLEFHTLADELIDKVIPGLRSAAQDQVQPTVPAGQ